MNKSFVAIIFALYMCGLSASHPLFMNGYSLGSQTNLGSNFITLDDIAEAMIVMPEEKQRKIYQALTELNENLTPRSKIQRFILSIPTVVQQKGNEIQSLQQTLSNNVLSSLLSPTSSALMPNQPSLSDVLSSGPSFHSHTHGNHHHLHKPIKTHGIDLIISTQTHEYKPEKTTKKSKNSSEKLKLDDKDDDDDFFSFFSDILDGFVKENIKPDDAPDKTKTADTVDDKAATTVDENLPEGDLKNVDQVADGNKPTETKSDESSISEEETSEATLDQSVDSVKKPDEEKFPNLAEVASEPSPNQSLNSPESTTGIISDQSLNSAEEPLQLIQQDLTFDSTEKATAQTSDDQSTDLQTLVEPKQNELEELSDLSSTNLNTTLESSQDKLDETISTESASQNQTMDSETTDRKIVESQEPIQGDESKTAEAISPQNKGLRRKNSMKGTKPRRSSNKDGAPNPTKKGGRNTSSKTKKSGEDTMLQKE